MAVIYLVTKVESYVPKTLLPIATALSRGRAEVRPRDECWKTPPQGDTCLGYLLLFII